MRIIIDLDDQIADALNTKAQGIGKDRKNFIQDLLSKVAAEPLVKERYALRFYADEGSAKGVIRRYEGGPNGTGGGCSDLNEAQFGAYKKAQDLIRRNGPGDREEAIFLLKTHFNNVFEMPV